MSTQSPLPQNDPLLIAFQQLKHTPEYRNAVNWTIKAENENHADGELWFAFAAGWNARNALAATPADPVREAATALVEVAEIHLEMNIVSESYGQLMTKKTFTEKLTALKTAHWRGNDYQRNSIYALCTFERTIF